MAGRRGAAARGQGRPAGPHARAATRPTTSAGPRPGSSRRCSRPARSPATPISASATWRPSRRWSGRRPDRPDFVADVQAMRRRVVDHIPPDEAGPPAQARARAVCATSSSPSSCCSSCTAAPTRRCVTPNTLARARAHSPPAGTSAATTAAPLADAYRFLRTLEHRLQLSHLRRTHIDARRPRLRCVRSAGRSG